LGNDHELPIQGHPDGDMLTIRTLSQARLGTKLFAAAALSYLVDGVLLAGFAAAGIVHVDVPIAYTITGLLSCALFHRLSLAASTESSWHRYYPLLQLTVSSLMLLAFTVLAPQAAFYFLTLLFTVFGFGSLGLTRTQSVCTWIGVSIAVAIVLSAAHLDVLIPDSTQSQKFLVWLSFSATLGRCMLLGVLGRSLRLHLQDRRRQLRIAVERLEERDKALELVNLELRRQATHDALTGLANRVLFVERLEQALREGEAFAVCALDLDGFKEVNDTLGHIAGDSLLQSVSQRLLATTRADDTVARTGGDEYLLLLRHIQCSAEAEAQAQRCLEVLSAPHRIGDRSLRISSSLGIARYPTDGTTAETILTYADAAMYQAKRSGKNAYRLYDGNVECFPQGYPSGEERVYALQADLLLSK
jgi:diguanylate cyclase (GGDEF)-like protein